MKIENIPLWPIVSVLVGILYFCWLIFAKDLKPNTRELFVKTGAFLHVWFGNFFAKTQFIEEIEPVVEINLRSWQTWVEWVLIVIPIWVYCLPFLDLGTLRNLPGLETEYFQAFDQVLVLSIKNHGQFPLWNPYFHTGIPYIAHPMLHVYNPFITIPVLLFGVLDGFKIAVFLGFVIAGFGIWWLGREVGLGAVVRIWVSLMFVFSGVPASKFIQGHYLLVFAFGWIPFSLAAILAATRSKHRLYICLAALGLGLLFFCGNAYYAYYMLYVVAILALLILFKFVKAPVFIKVNWGKVKVLVAILSLALGIIAIQLLPLLEYRDHFVKAVNTSLSDSQDVPTILQDFLSPDPFRPDAFSYALRPEEFYAYVGWWPLTALLLLPLAWNQKSRRFIPFFVTLIAFTFIWIDVKDMPWREFFQANPILFQFRYPSRMLVVGVMALIMAAGLGLNALLRKYLQNASWVETGSRAVPIRNGVILLAVGVFMLWSVYDLAATSRHLLGTVNNDQAQGQQAMSLLKQSDPEIYYIDGTRGWDQAIIGAEIRFQNIWDAIIIIPDVDSQISERRIQAQPKYLLLANDAIVPKDVVLLKAFDLISLYKTKNSLPFAFTLDTLTLNTFKSQTLSSEDVTAVTSLRQNINSIEGLVSADKEGALVLLSSFTSGWQLTIDGKPEKIYDASGFMAAAVEPGVHHYIFTYFPLYFFVGLFITLSVLCIILGILICEIKRHS